MKKSANIYIFNLPSRSKNILSKYSFLIKIDNDSHVFSGYHETCAKNEIDCMMESCLRVLIECFSLNVDSANIWFRSKDFEDFIKVKGSQYFFKGSGVTFRFYNVKDDENTKKRNLTRKIIKEMQCRVDGMRKMPKRSKEDNSTTKVSITSDASYCHNISTGTWSFSINDGKGVIRKNGICPSSVNDSYKAESYALRRGIIEVYDMGFKDIVCYCDCKELRHDKKVKSYIDENFPDSNISIKWIRRNSTPEHKRCDEQAGFVLNLLRSFDNIDLIKDEVNSTGEI